MLTAMTGLLADAVPAFTLRGRTGVDTVAPVTVPQTRPQFRPHVLTQELFRGLLIRERKRADRFEQPFALVWVEAAEGLRAQALASFWRDCLDALAAVRRDTDAIGWVARGKTMGLVLVDVTADEDSLITSLEGRLKTELQRRGQHGSSFVVHVSSYAPQDAVKGKQSEGRPLADEFAAPRQWAHLHRAFKRALDIVGSAALLIFLAPVFLLVALAVKFSSAGPVFFRQTRVGERAQPFKMLKFRSMHANSDAAIHQQYVSWFIKSSGQSEPQADGVFKLTNDPRITRVGHILRKTSLDELPQLWNVLRGDMSLVGPRPPLAYEVDQYRPWHCRRVLEAKPGITGLWQVSGRSRTTFDEMVRLDLRYARSYSLWTDVKILVATPRAVISGKGAC
jgi:exopolysaccharide biosynthesis polyprenyl glycosylphosphotransferase